MRERDPPPSTVFFTLSTDDQIQETREIEGDREIEGGGWGGQVTK